MSWPLSLFVVQVLTSVACVWSLVVNVRAWRRSQQRVELADIAIERTSLMLAAVLTRIDTCDVCGRTLDEGESAIVREAPEHGVLIAHALCLPPLEALRQ